jgi:hypothetical protein
MFNPFSVEYFEIWNQREEIRSDFHMVSRQNLVVSGGQDKD